MSQDVAPLSPSLAAIDWMTLAPEGPLLASLLAEADLSATARQSIVQAGADLVARIRKELHPGLMEVFLAEYGLSTDEGLALMSLAEALLRVPDAETSDALIEDKIAPADWKRHKGRSASSVVNLSTRGLMLTGGVLDRRNSGLIRSAVRRLGQPVIRAAVTRAMREMGRQFVLGQTIQEAMKRAAENPAATQSYDMLGEAAMTAGDARRYEAAYARAIEVIAGACTKGNLRDNPGISVKLSALHPRYETAQEARVMAELVPILSRLARMAAQADMPLTIDAEESFRLTLSLQVIEAVLQDPALQGWDGFGIVVQAYGRRAGAAIDWLHDMARRLDRKIMLRLVKGAYWDAEIKRAQVMGLADFPVWTRKVSTDVSYIGLARRLLGLTDRIYPQFATHNAHTVAAILHLAQDRRAFEFQRLHGMGERLHDIVQKDHGTRLRIYAPVGAHRELLAYLVRRLLENGANSSFVNQIVDEAIPPGIVAACPLTALEGLAHPENLSIARGPALFAPSRENSRGFDISDRPVREALLQSRDRELEEMQPVAAPLIAAGIASGPAQPVLNPATGAPVGQVHTATPAQIEAALAAARPWTLPVSARAETLRRAADLYESNAPLVLGLLAAEAGKTMADAVAELREAVDFLRYYAAQSETLRDPACGIFTAISPWNFPLAIFTGQIAAALAAGNGVLAKPAEQTPLIAHLAVGLMQRAGVPASALQLLPGDGRVGAALTRDPRVDGVVFTGSTETALKIRAAMAEHLSPTAPLIAETGGLNAMVVDSTALPEQAVRDILTSAFQSAGQRCSALRCLYLQEDIAKPVLEMLEGAMDELRLGDPAEITTDIGPVIDAEAKATIVDHITRAKAEGRLMKQLPAPASGHFIGPALIRLGSIAQMTREIFGPVLHVATFPADGLDRVVAEVNATGYGLTFGLHSRIESRTETVAGRIHAGNAYVNRNQIGAVVGSQPFGGEGLSGTGPKAGGPEYLQRFTARPVPLGVWDAAFSQDGATVAQKLAAAAPAHDALRELDLPGPTGEANRLRLLARDPVLCLGPGLETAKDQLAQVRRLGGRGVALDRPLSPDLLTGLQGFSGAVWWGDEDTGRAYARALAARQGPILPLIGALDAGYVLIERHLCIDTTASGGNAALLAGESLGKARR